MHEDEWGEESRRGALWQKADPRKALPPGPLLHPMEEREKISAAREALRQSRSARAVLAHQRSIRRARSDTPYLESCEKFESPFTAC